MKTWLIAALIVISAGIYWVMQSPYELANPGALINGHSKIARDCFKCHTPLLGPSDEKCAVCHKWTDKDVKNKKSAALHRNLVAMDCVACHTDHMETKTAAALRNFDHGLLARSLALDCRQCHTRPDDTLHHSLYQKCRTCHVDESWGKIDFKHPPQFKMDADHPLADCVKCHIGGSYGNYTCYGCHQHSAAMVDDSHSRKGIRYFDNCVGCHHDGGKATVNP